MKLTLSPKALFTLFFMLLPMFAYGDGFTRAVFQLSDATLGNGALENTALGNRYEFIAEYPASINSDAAIEWPEGCSPSQTNRYQSNDLIIETYRIDCDAQLVSGDKITVPYQVDAAIFELQLGAWQSRSIAANNRSGLELVLQAAEKIDKTLPDIATKYLFQGVLHIWFGWDHLAFVFCLCLLAASFRQLLWTITAFTIGHSISMALSFFKLVTIPIPPIEAIIAMSIILIAREAWFQVNQERQASQVELVRMFIVVLFFGLIHGLGFASALENIGVAENERIPALVFFNLGVELGQIAFVGMIFVIMGRLRKAQKAQSFAQVALFFVGSAGSFWAIERLSSFN